MELAQKQLKEEGSVLNKTVNTSFRPLQTVLFSLFLHALQREFIVFWLFFFGFDLHETTTKKVKQKWLKYILQGNTISIFLLQKFVFNSMCYLPIVCNYSWKLLKNTTAIGQTEHYTVILLFSFWRSLYKKHKDHTYCPRLKVIDHTKSSKGENSISAFTSYSWSH